MRSGRDQTGGPRPGHTGEPVWTAEDNGQERDFPAFQAAARRLRRACGFPILSGGNIVGVLEFFQPAVQEEDETLPQWMTAMGKQIVQFMERETAEEALRRAHSELEKRVEERTADLMSTNLQLEQALWDRRRLEHELLEITEKERRRIGLDLHDDLGQRLTGLTLLMKGLEVGLEKKGLPEAVEAGKILALIQQTVTHAGGLARDLAFGDLAQDNLPAALEDLTAHVKTLFDISCQFKAEGAIPPLEKNVIVQFCKITQEAVTNAVKHGKARQVCINLVKKSNRLVLTVRNNGLPFPSMIDRNNGMGLRIMNYRANVIGASLEIEPARPKGTLVTCCLPVKAKPAGAKPRGATTAAALRG